MSIQDIKIQQIQQYITRKTVNQSNTEDKNQQLH
jgi:hypothetical protein